MSYTSMKMRFRTPYGTAHQATIGRVRFNMNRTITEAKRVCAKDPGSKECRVAWSTVEELSETLYHLKQSHLTMHDVDPDDLEIREYDV